MKERLFTVRFKLSDGSASITAYDRGQMLGAHHTKLFCRLSWNGRVLFPESYFYVGIPGHQAVDGKYARETVTSLFCLKPGDTDSEFFADYTTEQIAWVKSHGDELSLEKEARWGSE